MKPPKEKLRAFIAISLEDPTTHQQCIELIDALKAKTPKKTIRWTPPNHLHITIKFFDTIDADKIPEISHQLTTIAQNLKPFPLEWLSLTTFPSHHPHIIVLTAKLTEPLAELVGAIERAMIQINLNPRKKPFLPHLTLGHLKTHSPVTLTKLLNNPPKPLPNNQTIKTLTLFKSQLTSEGSVYTPLNYFNLGIE